MPSREASLLYPLLLNGGQRREAHCENAGGLNAAGTTTPGWVPTKAVHLPVGGALGPNDLKRLKWKSPSLQKSARMGADRVLVIAVGTIRLVGSNANNVFSSVASTMN